VVIDKGESPRSEYEFRQNFQIGRDESCEIQLKDEGISRVHSELFLKNDQWWIKDLNSTNGIYLEGEKIKELPLNKNETIVFGVDSAVLSFYPEGRASAEMTMKDRPPSVNHYVEHYFADKPKEGMGQHTRMIRDAFQIVQKKHKSRYYLIIAVIAILFVLAGLYGFQKHRQVQKQQLLAEGIFYSMKSLELDMAKLKEGAERSRDMQAISEVEEYRMRQTEMSENYDQFLRELQVYDESKLEETDQLILRVARIFGECELTMPKDFVGEVKNYIIKWQSTSRLENAISRARENGYTDKVARIFLKQDLPPQFFYLALQESDFRLKTIGPRTRYGIAKGIWQFIPQTALKYGLLTGPLVEMERYDPRDERFDFEKATQAAAKYIRDIYNTDAQASGLLVIASYNWGERKVVTFIDNMPRNPRERNFWELLKNYREYFPSETYNYVFYIVSAAVIGENPKLFGFEFDNPLAFTDEYYRNLHK
jgi:hypothetical protein